MAYPKVKCFWVEPTGQVREYLRRFTWSLHSENGVEGCPLNNGGTHNAHVNIEVCPLEEADKRVSCRLDDDPRWPARCACGYEFRPIDPIQRTYECLYAESAGPGQKPAPDARVWSRDELPPGAMFNADWLVGRACWTGPDGMALMVVLPNKVEWNVDSRASNCTRKDDNVHKCWVREGTPPLITVGKGGNTCGAGAGSVLARDYHGFLRHGVLEPC